MSLSYMNIADPATYIQDEAQRLFDELLKDMNSEFSSAAIARIFYIEGIIDLEQKVENQYIQNIENINKNANMFSKSILIGIQDEFRRKMLRYLNDQKKLMREHDYVYIPPGVRHSFSNTGLDTLVFLVITTPVHDQITPI